MIDIKKLKIGDKVIVINNLSNEHIITMHNEYTIREIIYDQTKKEHFVKLEEVDYFYSFFIHRFKPNTKEERKQKLEKLKKI